MRQCFITTSLNLSRNSPQILLGGENQTNTPGGQLGVALEREKRELI